MSAHTPTPWHCYPGPRWTYIYGPDDEADDETALAARPEDAAHIVRCVNHHDELVKALQLCSGSDDGGVRTIALAALAKLDAHN